MLAVPVRMGQEQLAVDRGNALGRAIGDHCIRKEVSHDLEPFALDRLLWGRNDVVCEDSSRQAERLAASHHVRSG